jgi:hypothetical protein
MEFKGKHLSPTGNRGYWQKYTRLLYQTNGRNTTKMVHILINKALFLFPCFLYGGAVCSERTAGCAQDLESVSKEDERGLQDTQEA